MHTQRALDCCEREQWVGTVVPHFHRCCTSIPLSAAPLLPAGNHTTGGERARQRGGLLGRCMCRHVPPMAVCTALLYPILAPHSLTTCPATLPRMSRCSRAECWLKVGRGRGAGYRRMGTDGGAGGCAHRCLPLLLRPAAFLPLVYHAACRLLVPCRCERRWGPWTINPSRRPRPPPLEHIQSSFLVSFPCHVHYQKEWHNNPDRAVTNLMVNRRGAYEAEFRAVHTTSPGGPWAELGQPLPIICNWWYAGRC